MTTSVTSSHIRAGTSDLFFIFQLTVNSLADFFKTEKGVDLEVLTTATLSKLEEIKEKTATGQWFAFSFGSQLLPVDPKATEKVFLCKAGPSGSSTRG